MKHRGPFFIKEKKGYVGVVIAPNSLKLGHA